MNAIKERILLIFQILLCICLIQGCSLDRANEDLGIHVDKTDASTSGEFDFNRYYNQNMHFLFTDLNLTDEDFSILDGNNYMSNYMLAFEEVEGFYRLSCDSEDNLKTIDILVPFDKIEEGYQIVNELRNKYDSQKNSNYLSDEMFASNSLDHYKTYESFVNDMKNSKEEVFSSHGVWNLEDSVQVQLDITIFKESKNGKISISIMNSNSVYAMKYSIDDDESDSDFWNGIEKSGIMTASIRHDGKVQNLNGNQTEELLQLLIQFKDYEEYVLEQKMDEDAVMISITTNERDSFILKVSESYIVIEGRTYALETEMKDDLATFINSCMEYFHHWQELETGEDTSSKTQERHLLSFLFYFFLP